MLKIIYSQDGEHMADHAVKGWVSNLVNNYVEDSDSVVSVSNELAIETMRIEIKHGNIDSKEVLFFNGQDDEFGIRVDKDGNLEEWPKGFCDFKDSILETLLGWD